MRFTIEASELARVVETAGRATSRRSVVAVLGGVRLEASGGTLAVCGTDMQTAVFARAAYRGAGRTTGPRVAVAGPVAGLLTALKTLDGDVVVVTDEEKLLLQAGRTTLSFDLLCAADFPTVADDGEVLGSFPTEQLLALFQSVRRSFSRDESRPVLTGVLIEHTAGRSLTMAATDSYRLSLDSMPSGLDVAFEAIVPGVTLELVARLARKSERIQLVRREDGRGGQHFGFQADGVSVWGRTLVGTFPSWRQLLPDYAGGDSRVVFDRVQALTAVKRIAKLANGHKPVALSVAAGEPLRLELSQYEAASISDEIDADAQLPEPLRMGFNAAFLAETLEALTGDQVTMTAVSGLRPAVFRNGAETPWHLLMPIKLTDAYVVRP